MMRELRVYEYAKEKGLSSQEVLEILRSKGVAVKSHVNKLTEEQWKVVDRELALRAKEKEKAPPPVVEPPRVEKKEELSEPPALPPEEPVKVSELPPKLSREKGEMPLGVRTRPIFKIPSKVRKTPETVVKPPERKKAFRVKPGITLSELSRTIGVSIPDMMDFLMKQGFLIPQNKPLPEELILQIARHFKVEIELQKRVEEAGEIPDDSVAERMTERPPIITVMGHVDHGKTLLLDAIRKSRVAEKEVGGITQKIGAYQVEVKGKKITFIDTPGHKAFTSMRAHGARITDIAVLVVAADEGVKPQTLEALDHIRAAQVEMIVAVNKIDKPNAQVEKVKKELSDLGVVPDDWGGDVLFVPVSAKTTEGIDSLLEAILIVADLLELKADPEARPRATVIEASQSKEFGKNATVIVENGTLRKGDLVVIGSTWGRIKVLMDENLNPVKEALPGTPVRIVGLAGVPKPGDRLWKAADEREIRRWMESQKEPVEEESLPRTVKLEDFMERSREEKIKELRLVLKASSQGALEALKKETAEIPTGEMELKVLRTGVGDITSSDVLLAAASRAVVMGFDVGVEPSAVQEASCHGVDIRIYSVIFEVVEDVKRALLGLAPPEEVEEEIGEAEVKAIFRITTQGAVAGALVRKGVLERARKIVVYRNGSDIFTGILSSLRRFTEDVPRVSAGYECGIGIEGIKDLQEGDLIRCYKMTEKKKTAGEILSAPTE